MQMDLFTQLKTAYDLQAEQHLFDNAVAASQYFKLHTQRWLEQREIFDDYRVQLVKEWLATWQQEYQHDWLEHQVQTVFKEINHSNGLKVGKASDKNKSSHLETCMERLRFLRHLFQVRAIYRECFIFGRSNQLFISQMNEYSLFADLVFQYAEKFIRELLVTEWQLDQTPEPLIILGLGKLGAGELNLSSDVDLIFAYDHTVQLSDSKQRSSSEFYTRLGQRLIKFLGDFTPEGFVFRIDMRLRPFGQSGALVWSAQALETYYEQQGRMWERYAWIKTRVLTGGSKANNVISRLRPFVYRRYVDFSVIEALRDMKTLIEKEVNRTEAQENIKVGRGGIREVEFIVQVAQLIRGGELLELQEPSLMNAMKQITALNILPATVVDELQQDYLYLRRIEHFLQAWQDRQTQTLPSNEEQWQALVAATNHESREALEQQIQSTRDRIHHHFQQTIRAEKSTKALPEDFEKWAHIWPDQLEHVSATEIKEQLEIFLAGRALQKASDIARQRLNTVMPMMLTMLDKVSAQKSIKREATLSHQLQASLPELDIYCAGTSETLRRVLVIFEAILRRSAYFSLLYEHPDALFNVVNLCSMSAFLPQKLALYPSLLDEFVDDKPVYEPPSRDALVDELRQQILRLPEDDFEQQMARLRAFKQRHTLRVAVADISGHLPLMKVSDYLTWLAEALLQAALDIAWRKLTLKYGEPQRHEETGTGFLIVGYGKLGGLELSYTSDLDIVFLYDVPEQGETDGARVIDNSMFYMQLVKNLNHILMTDTLHGRLYEIDMRLRPSGSAGMFVSTFAGFQRYQEYDAWVWERQALVRARPVAGDAHLFSRFNELRKKSLALISQSNTLAHDVLMMRERMKSHFTPHADQFDLKHSAGGLIDIEFLAQHLVLKFAESHPAVTKFPDNVRIFELAMQEGVLSDEDGEALTRVYLLYRALIHRLSLQDKPIAVPAKFLVETRGQVIDIFERWFKIHQAQP